MKIAVWRTGHEIADRVAEAVNYGLIGEGRIIGLLNTVVFSNFDEIVSQYDIHIGYGILRGMDAVFRACDKAGKLWFNIDRGYWKPGHYDGYYRVSLRGTQQTFGLDKLEPDYGRWDRLGLFIQNEPAPYYRDNVLVCPPTDYAMNYFGIKPLDWIKIEQNQNWRSKSSAVPLDNDLNSAQKVITFNSSVGWEALRQGIPVVSDPDHSIVGAYQKMLAKDIHNDYEERRKLFSIQSSLQRNLTEIREGQLWPLLQKLISISSLAGTDAKQSLQTLPPIQSGLGQNPL